MGMIQSNIGNITYLGALWPFRNVLCKLFDTLEKFSNLGKAALFQFKAYNELKRATSVLPGLKVNNAYL